MEVVLHIYSPKHFKLYLHCSVDIKATIPSVTILFVRVKLVLIIVNKMTVDLAKLIPAFYAGQSIFLTGATGFLGKVFIEKVLRSCPDVREMFLLMRPKKELSVNQRLEKILNLS